VGPITIYGDSIMKAAVPNESFKYSFRYSNYSCRLEKSWGAPVNNRSQFGATVTKGLKTIQRDLIRNEASDYAIIEYGGNDCNFDWRAISADPCSVHLPATPLDKFLGTLERIVSLLVSRGVRPILMTLPPIDANKYLDFICKDGLSRRRIMLWLGDCDKIYSYHELYSASIAGFASEHDIPVIDTRSRFMGRNDLSSLISGDGIHLSEKGYGFLFSIFENVFAERNQTFKGIL